MSAIFFATAAEFRRWLLANHACVPELQVGFYKKGATRTGLTYREAVEEALCFGWIDGQVRRIDEQRYQHRFTPRRPGSTWSNVNVAHVERLIAAGRMHAAGLAAFHARLPAKTGVYAFERTATPVLPPAMARRFRAAKAAWAFFQAQPPGYRRLALHKVVSPKQAATRERWLARLIAASAAGQRLE